MRKPDKSDAQAAVEEFAATADTPNPACTIERLGELLRMVGSMVAHVTEKCQNPDEVRYVATVFKGAVDLWYRGGK